MKIIENNKTEFMIVYSKDAHECIRYASNLLQEYLYLATSVCVPLFSDKCDKRGKEIILGEARGIDIRNEIQGLSEEAFVIKEVDGNLCFAANSPRGILYSVIRRKKISYLYTTALGILEIATVATYFIERAFDLGFDILPCGYVLMEYVILGIIICEGLFKSYCYISVAILVTLHCYTASK